MNKRKQTKKEFYPGGTEKSKRAMLFNLQVTNSKEYKRMNLAQRIIALAFLEDCKNSLQSWIDELKE